MISSFHNNLKYINPIKINSLKSEDMIKYGNTEEFKEFAKAKDMELKERIKNTSDPM